MSAKLSVVIAVCRSWLKTIGEVLRKAADLEFPKSPWEWIGSADALYARVEHRDGLEFTGRLRIDSESTPWGLGTLSDEGGPGWYPTTDGRYFCPATSLAEREASYLENGHKPLKARRLAERRVMEDLQALLAYRKSWFMYRLEVEARRNNVVVAKLEVCGLRADPHVNRMDSRVDDVFWCLVDDARQAAHEAVDTAVSRWRAQAG